MTAQQLFENLGNVGDRHVLDALPPSWRSDGAPPSEKRPSALSRFLSSGVVAAVLSAVVAVGVIVAIVLAGRGGDSERPPVGGLPEESTGDEVSQSNPMIFNYRIDAPDGFDRGKVLRIYTYMTKFSHSDPLPSHISSAEFQHPKFQLYYVDEDGQKRILELGSYDCAENPFIYTGGLHQTAIGDYAVTIPEDAPATTYHMTVSCPWNEAWFDTFENVFTIQEAEPETNPYSPPDTVIESRTEDLPLTPLFDSLPEGNPLPLTRLWDMASFGNICVGSNSWLGFLEYGKGSAYVHTFDTLTEWREFYAPADESAQSLTFVPNMAFFSNYSVIAIVTSHGSYMETYTQMSASVENGTVEIRLTEYCPADVDDGMDYRVIFIPVEKSAADLPIHVELTLLQEVYVFDESDAPIP